MTTVDVLIDLEKMVTDIERIIPKKRVFLMLCMYYGIKTEYPLLMREIGEKFGLSTCRVGQLLRTAIYKLSNDYEMKKYKEILFYK